MDNFKKIIISGESADEVMAGPDCSVGCEEESEVKKLLRQAIALSLEESDENDRGEEDNEEKLLKQAIALSLTDC